MLNRFQRYFNPNLDYQQIPSDDIDVKININDKNISHSDKKKNSLITAKKFFNDPDIYSPDKERTVLATSTSTLNLRLIWNKVNTYYIFNIIQSILGYCLKDYLNSNEIALLKKYNLNSYTDIYTAKKVIKVLIETLAYNQILTSHCWGIVRDYLTPLYTKKIIAEAKTEAKHYFTNIKKLSPIEIIKKAQVDEEEAELLMESFGELQLEYESIRKREQSEKKKGKSQTCSIKPIPKNAKPLFYYKLSSQLQRVQVLDNKISLYSVTAKNIFSNILEVEETLSNLKQSKVSSPKREEAKNAYIITNAIKSRIHIFANTTLIYSCNLINKVSETDKNYSCLKAINMMAK
jgi:hypothetical protein